MSLIRASSEAPELPQAIVDAVETPALVYDLPALAGTAADIAEGLADLDVQLVYPLKALAQRAAMEAIAPHLGGWSASSPFEARLARELCRDGQEVHFTAPGVRPADLPTICTLSDHIAANSLHQRALFGAHTHDVGLRINPGLAFAENPTWDPCSPRSRLGVPLDVARAHAADYTGAGIHLHGNCESEDLGQLEQTIDHLLDALPGPMAAAPWINLGGGYLLNEIEADDYTPLARTAERLRAVNPGVPIFTEPGMGLVGAPAWLVASVVDLVAVDGVTVAVLDTSVNHLPETLEFDYRPEIAGDHPDHPHEVHLAGCSCQTADRFGVFRLAAPLDVGARIVFPYVGAYTLVKACLFNGIALPTRYALEDGALRVLSRSRYDDYLAPFRCD